MGEATKPDGTVEQIGHILVNWVREQVVPCTRWCCDLPGHSSFAGRQTLKSNKTLKSSEVMMIRTYSLVKSTCVTDLLANNAPA